MSWIQEKCTSKQSWQPSNKTINLSSFFSLQIVLFWRHPGQVTWTYFQSWEIAILIKYLLKNNSWSFIFQSRKLFFWKSVFRCHLQGMDTFSVWVANWLKYSSDRVPWVPFEWSLSVRVSFVCPSNAVCVPNILWAPFYSPGPLGARLVRF